MRFIQEGIKMNNGSTLELVITFWAHVHKLHNAHSGGNAVYQTNPTTHSNVQSVIREKNVCTKRCDFFFITFICIGLISIWYHLQSSRCVANVFKGSSKINTKS